jgi:hypothetical protein
VWAVVLPMDGLLLSCCFFDRLRVTSAPTRRSSGKEGVGPAGESRWRVRDGKGRPRLSSRRAGVQQPGAPSAVSHILI